MSSIARSYKILSGSAELSAEVDLSTGFFLCGRICASHWVALSAANPPANSKAVRNFPVFVRKACCKLAPLPKWGLAGVFPCIQTRVGSGLGRPLLAGIESQPVYLNDSTGQRDFPNILLNLRHPERTWVVFLEKQWPRQKVASAIR